jgi:hypothetical protein
VNHDELARLADEPEDEQSSVGRDIPGWMHTPVGYDPSCTSVRDTTRTRSLSAATATAMNAGGLR